MNNQKLPFSKVKVVVIVLISVALAILVLHKSYEANKEKEPTSSITGATIRIIPKNIDEGNADTNTMKR